MRLLRVSSHPHTASLLLSAVAEAAVSRTVLSPLRPVPSFLPTSLPPFSSWDLAHLLRIALRSTLCEKLASLSLPFAEERVASALLPSPPLVPLLFLPCPVQTTAPSLFCLPVTSWRLASESSERQQQRSSTRAVCTALGLMAVSRSLQQPWDKCVMLGRKRYMIRARKSLSDSTLQ